MTTKLLLPHSAKKYGWLLFVPASLLGIFFLITGYEPQWLPFGPEIDGVMGSGKDLTLTAVAVAYIIGGLLVAFSREAFEDEYIAHVRLTSLQWALLLHFVLLLLLNLFSYGLNYLLYSAYSMYVIMLLFLARFHFKLHATRKAIQYED